MRSLNREVATEGGIELCYLVDDAFCRDGYRHIAQRHVAGQRCQAHLVAHEDVKAFLVCCHATLNELLIAGEVETVDMHVLFLREP